MSRGPTDGPQVRIAAAPPQVSHVAGSGPEGDLAVRCAPGRLVVVPGGCDTGARWQRGGLDGAQRLVLAADAAPLRRPRPQRLRPPHLRPHYGEQAVVDAFTGRAGWARGGTHIPKVVRAGDAW